MEVRGADAGSFPDAKEVYKGEDCKAGGVGICEGMHVLCQGDEEVRCCPELRWCWRSQALEGFGKGPMERGDSGR